MNSISINFYSHQKQRDLRKERYENWFILSTHCDKSS